MDDLERIVQSAREELGEWLNDNPTDRYAQDQIFEIADQAVPIWHSQVMQLVTDNIWLATTPLDDPGLAGDNPTAEQIIKVQLLLHIEQELYEMLNDAEDTENLDGEELWEMLFGCQDEETKQEFYTAWLDDPEFCIDWVEGERDNEYPILLDNDDIVERIIDWLNSTLELPLPDGDDTARDA